jgi:putative transposase
MAWGEIKVEDQRLQFCMSVANGIITLSEGCRQFNISRPTGYEWLKRYNLYGEEGLKNRSSARLSQNHETSEFIKEQILVIKHEYVNFGPKKIHAKLKERYPCIDWPGTTTIEKILSKNGLTKKRKLRRRLAAITSPLNVAEEVNDIWCMDFKGWSLTADHFKFDPFTLTDQYSRYLLRALKLDFNTLEHVWPLLDCAFREYGLPRVIRSDNGPPFATTAPGRFSLLAVCLVKAGVMPEWIDPGNPQQNGSHERMHLTMKQECISLDLTKQEQSRKLEKFQEYYNFERPHEAIGQKIPGSLYVPSKRIWTGKLKSIEYSSDYMVSGKVGSCGKMSWKNKSIYISRVFVGERLGIKEGQNGLGVYFGPYFLGILNSGNELEVTRRESRKKNKKEKV